MGFYIFIMHLATLSNFLIILVFLYWYVLGFLDVQSYMNIFNMAIFGAHICISTDIFYFFLVFVIVI